MLTVISLKDSDQREFNCCLVISSQVGYNFTQNEVYPDDMFICTTQVNWEQNGIYFVNSIALNQARAMLFMILNS